jgi:hypothetical protein
MTATERSVAIEGRATQAYENGPLSAITLHDVDFLCHGLRLAVETLQRIRLECRGHAEVLAEEALTALDEQAEKNR